MTSPFAGEENSPSTFHLQLAKDETLKARADAVIASVAAHLKELGVDATRNEIEELPSVRIAVLTGTPIGDEQYEREIKTLPGVARARKDKELAERVAAGDEAFQAELDSMTPTQRMNFAREHNLNGSTIKPDSEEDRAAKQKIAQGIENPAAKIAYARTHGLI